MSATYINTEPYGLSNKPIIDDYGPGFGVWLSFLLSFIMVLFVVVGVVGYFIAKGDKSKANKAKKITKYALLGIAIIIVFNLLYREVIKIFM